MRRPAEGYFIVLLAAWLLAGCAGYAAVVLYTADAHEAVMLASSFPLPRPAWPHVATGFMPLCLVLAGIAVLGGLIAILLSSWPRWRNLVGSPAEPSGKPLSEPSFVQAWHTLTRRQRRLALGAFIALSVLRLIVSRLLITFDDSTSYSLFVSKSFLVVSAWYIVPNNHVLSNTLSWLFYQVHPDYWWSMRVPVLLLSTVGTAGWFLELLRRSTFRVAALAVVLFSFLEASLFYAVEGRGYALVLVLSCVGFFCTLRLTEGSRDWAGLALAGTLGLYTVPTFAYFLVAAYSWLGINWLRQQAYRKLLLLGLVGIVTLLGATLLYTPLLVISGPAALLHNVYVKPLIGIAFWRALPAHLVEVEGILMGESAKGAIAALHLGLLVTIAIVTGFVALGIAAYQGHVPARTVKLMQRLGVPALWFVLVPYTLMLEQHVLAPYRTLLFKTIFMFLLAAIEADWLLWKFGPKNRWLRPTLLLGVGLWMGLQVVDMYRANELNLHYIKTKRSTFQRLFTEPPVPVTVFNPPVPTNLQNFWK